LVPENDVTLASSGVPHGLLKRLIGSRKRGPVSAELLPPANEYVDVPWINL